MYQKIEVIEKFFEGYEKEVFGYYERMKPLSYKEQIELVRSGKMTKGNFRILQDYPLTFPQKGKCYGIDELVHRDMEGKKAELYATIQKKMAEEITEVKLYQGEDGTMNGTLRGATKRLTIHTIRAGGYNIQCLHYRVLIKVRG